MLSGFNGFNGFNGSRQRQRSAPIPTQNSSPNCNSSRQSFRQVNSAHGIATIGLKKVGPDLAGGIGVEAGTCSLGKSAAIILPLRDKDIKFSVTRAGPPRLAAPSVFVALAPGRLCPGTVHAVDDAVPLIARRPRPHHAMTIRRLSPTSTIRAGNSG